MTADGAQLSAAITFAIPYYDNLVYLREAIDSVLAQSVAEWRLIVVDDAGPAPADDLVAEYDDPRISLHRNEHNLGLAGNWNACIALAETPWVALLHADDRLEPGYADAVIRAADRNPELAAIFTDALVIDAVGDPARSLPETVKRFARRPNHDHDVAGDSGLAGILTNNYVMCPTLCYRTAIAARHPFDARWKMVMDLEHTAALLLAGHTLHGIRRPLYRYRRHAGNQTATLTASAVRFEEEIALYQHLAEQAAARSWMRTARAGRRRWMVRTHLLMQVGVDLLRRRRTAAGTKFALLRDDLVGPRGA